MLLLVRGVAFAIRACDSRRARVRAQELIVRATVYHVATALGKRGVDCEVAIDALCASDADAESARALALVCGCARARARTCARIATEALCARAWSESLAWARATTFDACFVARLDAALITHLDLVARAAPPHTTIFAAHPLLHFRARGVLSDACFWLPSAAATARFQDIAARGGDAPIGEMLHWPAVVSHEIDCLFSDEHVRDNGIFLRIVWSARSLLAVRRAVGAQMTAAPESTAAPPRARARDHTTVTPPPSSSNRHGQRGRKHDLRRDRRRRKSTRR